MFKRKLNLLFIWSIFIKTIINLNYIKEIRKNEDEKRELNFQFENSKNSQQAILNKFKELFNVQSVVITNDEEYDLNNNIKIESPEDLSILEQIEKETQFKKKFFSKFEELVNEKYKVDYNFQNKIFDVKIKILYNFQRSLSIWRV